MTVVCFHRNAYAKWREDTVRAPTNAKDGRGKRARRDSGDSDAAPEDANQAGGSPEFLKHVLFTEKDGKMTMQQNSAHPNGWNSERAR